MPSFTYVWIGCTFFLAGVVKGVVGVGLPSLSMGLLTLFLAPSVAASTLVVPSFATNVWQMSVGRSFTRLSRRFWIFLVAIAIGTPLGIPILTRPGHGLAEVGLGAVLAGYAALGLFAPHWRVPDGSERWLSPLLGLVSGVVTGATGTFVVPVPYFASLGLERDDLIQALGLAFTVSTVALAATLAAARSFPLQSLWLSGLALIPALAGMAVGTALRRRLNPVVFRRAFFTGLALLGGSMLLRPWL